MKKYKASYFYRLLSGDYNPFTPDMLVINDHMIEHKKRNWYLISVNTQSYHFQNIIGIDVDKHILGASLVINTTGTAKIYVHGFSKGTASEIRELCVKYITDHSHRGRAEAAARPISVADELQKLKGLLDTGAINEGEYATQKAKVLNG